VEPQSGAAGRSGRRALAAAFAATTAIFVLSAGFATTSFGLHATTVVYSRGVVALGLIALAAQRMRSGRQSTPVST
jgi:hypothetical protein